MKKRLIRILSFMALFLLIFSGIWFGIDNITVSTNKTELYLNKLEYFNDKSEEIMNVFNKEVIENYNVESLEKDIIPNFEKLVEKINKYKPRSNLVENIHDVYSDAMNKQLEFFVLYNEGLQTADTQKIIESQQKLQESYELLESHNELVAEISNKRELANAPE